MNRDKKQTEAATIVSRDFARFHHSLSQFETTWLPMSGFIMICEREVRCIANDLSWCIMIADGSSIEQAREYASSVLQCYRSEMRNTVDTMNGHEIRDETSYRRSCAVR